MKVIGVSPARYQSSRFPGKPLALICGKPMLWWVYQQCLKVGGLDDVYVATDSSKILEKCDELSMKCIITGDNPTGSDRVAEAAEKLDGDVFINIQGDEPIIEPAMIQQVVDLFKDDTVSFGTLKSEITDTEEISAQSTVKVVTDENDDAMYFSRSVIPSNVKDGNLSKVYRHVGIYGYRKNALQLFHSWEQPDIELGEGIEPLRAMYHGYKIRVSETEYQSIGVDYPEHIALVEKVILEKTAPLNGGGGIITDPVFIFLIVPVRMKGVAA